jgi:hypothetical protein
LGTCSLDVPPQLIKDVHHSVTVLATQEIKVNGYSQVTHVHHIHMKAVNEITKDPKKICLKTGKNS